MCALVTGVQTCALPISTSVLRSQPASNPGKSSAASVEIRMNDPCSMSLDNIERVKPFPYYALARNHPEQIMLVGILDFDIDDVAGFQRRRDIAQIDMAVELGRVGLGAACGAEAAVLLGLADLVRSGEHR